MKKWKNAARFEKILKFIIYLIFTSQYTLKVGSLTPKFEKLTFCLREGINMAIISNINSHLFVKLSILLKKLYYKINIYNIYNKNRPI